MDNEGEHIQLIPDEVQEYDLLGQHDQNEMQLGFVQLIEPLVDPVMRANNQQLPPDLFRLWSTHLAPYAGLPVTHIPPEWAPFFTVALMNPASHDWAKRFISSPAWAYFASPNPNDFPVTIPSKCPVATSPTCLVTNGDSSFSKAEEIVASELHKMDEKNKTPDSSPVQSPASPSEVPLHQVSPSIGPWAKSLLAKAGKVNLTENDPALRRSCR